MYIHIYTYCTYTFGCANMRMIATPLRKQSKKKKTSTTFGCADVRIIAISFCSAGKSVVFESCTDDAQKKKILKSQCPCGRSVVFVRCTDDDDHFIVLTETKFRKFSKVNAPVEFTSTTSHTCV